MARNIDYGWMKYVWLVYLFGLFMEPFQLHAGWSTWLATLGVIAVFLYLYFSIFAGQGRRKFLTVIAIAVLGLVYMPFNPGAATLVIYAAAFVGLVVNLAPAMIVLAALLAITAVEMWLLHFPAVMEAPMLTIAAAIGLGNIYFGENARTQARLKKADEEIQQLAKIAERERIARDLHDVLGHTLSVIVLKSELASKLIDSDPAAAGREIRDVESVSREALAEVRKAIIGYRAADLHSELTRAVDTLGTAGIDVETEWTDLRVPAAQENVLALALREAVLNVVRHSHARRCRLRLSAANGVCNLEVYDDGRGATAIEGNGLRGMRERVEALGGALNKQLERGTLVRITLPFEATP
jgi:two-component system sensor histidine kinase DesK